MALAERKANLFFKRNKHNDQLETTHIETFFLDHIVDNNSYWETNHCYVEILKSSVFFKKI